MSSIDLSDVQPISLSEVQHEKNKAHQFFSIVETALKGVIETEDASGVEASIAIKKAETIEAMNSGVSPDEVSRQVSDAVIHRFMQIAQKRLDVSSFQSELEGEVVGVTRMSGVVFSDRQFNDFMVALETALLNVCDTAVAIALADEPQKDGYIAAEHALGSGASIEPGEYDLL